MFAKKQHGDVKKSTQKLLDPKKDTVTRLKHLRIVLAECQDTAEVKKFCEANYHCIYFIFYDVFIQVEASLRQRAHKAHREELESVLYIFEKILTLLPELLHRRWQFHSIGRIMKKLLHPGNALRLRKEAMRLFLIWYQVLGERSSGELDLIYASLVPGFPNPSNSSGAHSLESLISDSAYSSSPVFHDSAVSAVEIQPILPPQSGEKQLDSPCHYFMESLLDYSVSQVVRVEWSDVKMHTICFDFLFERLKTFYLPYIFPNMSQQMSLYQPKLTLPEVRKLSAGDVDRERDVTLCQVAVIRWMCLFMHELKKHDTLTIGSVNSPSISDTLKDIPETGNEGDTDRSQSTEASDTPTAEGDSLSSSIGSAAPRHSSTEQEIVRYVLNSTRENVNLVHEVFRQAFFVPPAHAAAIRRVLFAYKDWLQTINSSDMPLFLQEPLAKELELRAKEAANRKSAIYTPPFPSEDMLDKHFTQEERKMEDVRAGMQNVLQVFMTNAASVFLLNGNWALASHLDDHIDICKRVLSIYRYVVMNVTMATATWEQLLKVLMHVISSVLEGRPAIKEKTLGGRLASVLFQTLIVTWIKANLNVYISAELWDQFLSVLSSLTHWEELVQEWSKTMDTLTRVLVRHVYSLELNDLPLDRLTEQKRKRTKGQNCCVESSRQDQHRLAAGTFTRNWSRYSGPPAVGNGYENRECLSPADKLENSGTLLRSKEEYGRVRSVSGGDVTEQPRPMSLGTTVTLPLVRSTSDGDLSSKDNSPDCLQGGEEIMLASRGRMSDDPQLLKAFAMNHATSLEEEGSKIYQDQEYDEEVASISVSGDSHSIDRLSLGATLLERSERGSSTPSPPGMNFEVGSHSRSVSPSSFDTRAVQETGEVVSMPIDVVVTDDGQVKVTDLENQGCVLAGGCVQGWLPDSAVVLWQRMLGCLGNVNKIKDPKIHAQVMEYICNLYNVLLKVRLNQGVSGDSQTSPPPPALIPPLHVFAPWLFQSILEQTDEYKKGKLIAYKLLCMETCQRHDIELPPEYLSHLYSILHTGLVSSDQDVVNTIVRYSSPRFFSLCLPGATMLLQGYMHAANTILATTGMREERGPKPCHCSVSHLLC
ncbi:PREDICTED: ral GTPase-activating protein subunit alpha-1-like [Priapulus caudatus]|uniref:Ral GTPase-activating protein subunit alpha-1-like n=1 Tax=Priapulus caudatus TaxID=37621 RepID=A0ABM1DT76_PRICU|nr:PREDICTED: ral GTPase-activating protein subunit alpha-1-like [Priapulus caudatus]